MRYTCDVDACQVLHDNVGDVFPCCHDGAAEKARSCDPARTDPPYVEVVMYNRVGTTHRYAEYVTEDGQHYMAILLHNDSGRVNRYLSYCAELSLPL